MNLGRKVYQYGDSSIYFENNSGLIILEMPHEIKKFLETNSSQLEQFKLEVGAHFAAIMKTIDEAKANITITNSKNVVNQSQLNANYIHIGDNINSTKEKPPHALTLSPFQPEYFIGREEDLIAIRQKLQSPTDNALLLLSGLGGMGKTTLASKYYHTYQHEYNHVAWILCEQGIANALLQLAEQLHVEFEDKTPPEVRLNQVLKAMAELPKPCLLVIDNANEIEDLEKNYQKLRQCSNFHLLITTRVRQFYQAQRHVVEGLPKKQALELFRKYYPALNEKEEHLFHQIRVAVGGNTLVLELLAKNLQLQNKIKTKYHLEDLLYDLQNKGLLQLTYSKTVSTDYRGQDPMRSETPEAIIGAMYDLTHVSREETKILSVFAVLPAEAIRFEILEIIFQNDSELERKVIQLYKKGWIEFNAEEKSFKCSPVIQDVVKAKNDTLFEDCEGLIDLINQALDTENIHPYESSSFFAHYAASILKNLSVIEYKLGLLCHNLGEFSTMTGDLSLAMSAYEKMHTILNALLLNEPDNVDFKNGLAVSYQFLGNTYINLGNLQQALTFFEQYNTIEKELYEAYPNNVNFKDGLASSYEKLGSTQTALGSLQQALAFFEKFNILEKELYEAYPHHVKFKDGLAISYEKLGDTHTALGNLQKALIFFKQYNTLEKELYEAYPNNVNFKNGLAISYAKLGETNTDLGNLQKALTFFEDEFSLTKELYEAYPNNVNFKNGLAISYQFLGSTHTALGNLQQALTFFEQYNTLEKELYEAYPNNVNFKNNLAISYSKLGETHADLGNLQQTLTFFEKYNTLEKELYEAYPNNVNFKNNLAISYYKLGVFYRDQKKDHPTAKKYFQQCFQIWKELHESFPEYKEFKKNYDWAQNALSNIERKQSKKWWQNLFSKKK